MAEILTSPHTSPTCYKYSRPLPPHNHPMVSGGKIIDITIN